MKTIAINFNEHKSFQFSEKVRQTLWEVIKTEILFWDAWETRPSKKSKKPE